MLRNWPLLFIIVPIIEIYFLIKVGGYIGALWTVMLVVLTAIIGVNLLRYQGFSTLRRAQQNMAQGAMPAMEMMEGIFLAVGGALLITPGFVTDAMGFFCLIPISRQWLIRYLLSRSNVHVSGFGSSNQQYTNLYNDPGNDSSNDSRGNSRHNHESDVEPDNRSGRSSGRTLEGEFTRKDE